MLALVLRVRADGHRTCLSRRGAGAPGVLESISSTGLPGSLTSPPVLLVRVATRYV